MASRTPRESVQRRLSLLQSLLDGPFEGNKAELGRRLGYKDGSIIGQYLRGDRPVTEATEKKLAGLPEMRKVHVDIHQTLAQPLSQLVPYLPVAMDWEELMNKQKLPNWPKEVTVVVPDGALEPHVRRGDHLTFESCESAEPTSVVVVETEDGERWIRRLVRKEDGSLWAASTTDALPSFPAVKILAKATRRSSPFSGF